MVRERGERPEKPMPPPAAPKPVFEPPIDWWRLDAEERTETLSVLFEWVPELVRRYGLTDAVVPPCWYRHEALIQELLALYQYRQQQQFLPAAPPSAPLDFHYQFQLVIGRLRSWVGQAGCNTSEHMETTVQSWADPGQPRAAAWDVDAYTYLEGAQLGWAREETE